MTMKPIGTAISLFRTGAQERMRYDVTDVRYSGAAQRVRVRYTGLVSAAGTETKDSIGRLHHEPVWLSASRFEITWVWPVTATA